MLADDHQQSNVYVKLSGFVPEEKERVRRELVYILTDFVEFLPGVASIWTCDPCNGLSIFFSFFDSSSCKRAVTCIILYYMLKG